MNQHEQTDCTHERTEKVTPVELHPTKYGVMVWTEPYLECLDCHATINLPGGYK